MPVNYPRAPMWWNMRMSREEEVNEGRVGMPYRNKSTVPGKIVFTITIVAMLIFFWWLLIYDHGVMPIHH